MLGARVFRVFISSTFTDTVAERNTLQGCVFEELRAYCALKGYGFQPVDLRWGIGEEASSGQRTMRICLSEIARCQAVSPRPNFVVLLGDRYGWRPLPEVVDAREFDTLRALLDAEEAALADACYHRDDNAVPPVYTLRSKADTKVNWDDAQTHLRPALVTAAGQAGLDEATAAKYWLSATEQEIVEGALTAPHADDHVFCLMRAIERLPADAAAYRDLMPDGSLDTEAAGMLADLKRRLKDRLGDNHVKEYTATWQGDAPSTAHIAELCADMLAALKGVIDQEIERLSELTHLEQERAAHEVFAQERSECFVGRVEYLDRIADYLAVGSDHPLCVFSEGGLGKSALVATAAARAAETHPDAAIVARYIGVTSASADPRSLLADLCAEIGVVYGSTDPVPSTLQELQHELPKRL